MGRGRTWGTSGVITLGVMGRPSPLLTRRVLGRVTRSPVSEGIRADHILVSEDGKGLDARGYGGALLRQQWDAWETDAIGIPAIHGVARLDHLADGDVVALDPSGYVRTLYRRASSHNAIFATDRCSSYCLMCSQPPKDVDDRDLIHEHLRLVDLIDPSTTELGITGGEPTLLKDDLIRLLQHCKATLPDTAIHVLSNGRLFYYGAFAKAIASVRHPDLMFGIPLYSDVDDVHDHVVQCRGAFDETVVGLQNLGRFGVATEIRVVIHRLTYARLLNLADFIYRNFPFAAHVALMGLEPMGFAMPNLDALWIDPWDYRSQLEDAVTFLDDRGLRVSVYNHQLCVVNEAVQPFCRQSISDWKNDYLAVCATCEARARCSGFFSSSLRSRTSSHVRPLCS